MIEIRCSSLPRLSLCPGSLKAAEGIQSADSTQNIEGSAGHVSLERYYGQPFSEDKKPIDAFVDTLNEMTASRARWYSKTIDGLISEHGGAKEVLTEVEMSEMLCDGVLLTGHADLIVPCRDGITLLVDYKFNYLEVPRAAQNTQLMGYAWLWSQGFTYPSTIHAILTAGGNDEPFTATAYTPETIKAAKSKLQDIVQSAVLRDVRNPSDEGCRYCPAHGTNRCPETATETMMLPATLPENPELLPSTQDCIRLFKAIKTVESYGKKFLPLLKAEVEANPEAWQDLFVLQSTGSTRTIKDAQAAYHTIVEEAGLIDAETFLSLVSLGIGDLESALKPVLKERDVPVKDQKAFVAGLLGDNLELKEKAKSLKAAGE